MNTYLLEWNPEYWARHKIDAELQVAYQSGSDAIRWDIGVNRDARPGDRVFMMRVHSKQGIVGAGWITSLPADGLHWRADKAAKGKSYIFVKVNFDRLLEEPLITLDELNLPPFAGHSWTPHRSGYRIPERFATALESRWSDVTGTGILLEKALEKSRAQLENHHTLAPSDLTDARKRILAAIVQRQGQGEFRKQLLDAYQRSCAVTGPNVAEALEAAHIMPYLGAQTNSVTNGLLLRADIHTLFDLDLIAVDPSDFRVLISDRLKSSPYVSVAGQKISLPEDVACRPGLTALQERLEKFKCQEVARRKG